MQHRIAAIIPLYNGEAFIRESLESILAQTVPLDDIIVVDDGSTDGGPTVVETVMRENSHAPIRLLRKSNGGQSSARNLGIASTNCDLIALLDQDDIWYPNHVELLAKPFESDRMGEIGLVYGNLDQIDRGGRLVQRRCLDQGPTEHPKTSRLQCLSGDMFILPGASLLRKRSVQLAGGFDERLSGYEDDDLFVRMFSLGMQLVYLNTPVSLWRIYSASTSFSPTMARSRMIYFFKLVESFPDDPGIDMYWTRDVIAPRFFRQVVQQFLRGLKQNDPVQVSSSLENVKQIAPYLPSEYRREISRMTPVIRILLALSLNSLVLTWVGNKIKV